MGSMGVWVWYVVPEVPEVTLGPGCPRFGYRVPGTRSRVPVPDHGSQYQIQGPGTRCQVLVRSGQLGPCNGPGNGLNDRTNGYSTGPD